MFCVSANFRLVKYYISCAMIFCKFVDMSYVTLSHSFMHSNYVGGNFECFYKFMSSNEMQMIILHVLLINTFYVERFLKRSAHYSTTDWFPFDCWTAPELELHPGNFTIQADVWAFGILFYVLLTRRMNPYEGQQSLHLLLILFIIHFNPVKLSCRSSFVE